MRSDWGPSTGAAGRGPGPIYLESSASRLARQHLHEIVQPEQTDIAQTVVALSGGAMLSRTQLPTELPKMSTSRSGTLRAPAFPTVLAGAACILQAWVGGTSPSVSGPECPHREAVGRAPRAVIMTDAQGRCPWCRPQLECRAPAAARPAVRLGIPQQHRCDPVSSV